MVKWCFCKEKYESLTLIYTETITILTTTITTVSQDGKEMVKKFYEKLIRMSVKLQVFPL